MSYYILPKINNQIVINPTKITEEFLKPYISHSLLQYITTIKCHINKSILNSDDLSFNNYIEIIKYINPCEFIFSKIPGSKYSVSKLKPTSNLFYGKTLNKLDISYREVFILGSLAFGNLSLGLFPFFFTEYINTCCAELIVSCCR